MADYLPKAEQLDTMNQRLAELNEHLQKREDFTAAMAKLDSATKKAESLKDGFSPAATVTQTSTGADVSITDKNGTTNAHIENGSDANVTAENIKNALGYTPLETAPVTSVNGKTGAVELAASDVGAISDTDGSVQNAHLADSSVTTDKLAEAERMTSANIVGALGYEPVKPEGFELIRELALTEDTYQVVVTEDENGKTFTLRRFVAMVSFPTNDYDFSIFVGLNLKQWVAYVYVKGFYRAVFDVYPFSDGYWQCAGNKLSSASERSYSYNAAGVSKDTVRFSGAGTTTSSVALQGVSDSKPFKSGTTIKIYGIRA